jgi:hypothetical protein
MSTSAEPPEPPPQEPQPVPAQPADRPVTNGGGGGGITLIVAPGITDPLATTPLFVGVPYTVKGAASAEISTRPPADGIKPAAAFKVESVTVTVDGNVVPTSDDSAAKDWSSWHAVVTPAAAGPHTIVATASAGDATATQTRTVQASPMLSRVGPVQAGGYFSLLNVFTIQVASTSVFNMEQGGSTWECQVTPGGTAGPPAAVGHQAGQGTWQLTVALPAVPVPAGGTQDTLTITATTAVAVAGGTQNVSLPLSIPVLAVDRTAPVFLSGTIIPANVPPGATPTVTVQVTDEANQVVFSGVRPNGVTVQLDGQQVPATQTVAGDPSTWTATLPPVTQAPHQVTVTATDAAGNTATRTQQVPVLLQSWTRLEPSPRDLTLIEGLQARIADPAWLLARQAAFGELTGTDNASPVTVRMRARASALTRLRPAYQAGTTTPATGPGALLPADAGPLEVLTEAEPEPAPGGPARPLFGAQAGLHYRRLLRRAAGVGDLTAYEQGLARAYPIKTAPSPPASSTQPVPPAPGEPPLPQQADPALQPYLAGQIPDGERLYADLAAALRPPGPGTLPTAPPLDAASPTIVTSVARQWLAWYDAVSGAELGTRDTWRPDRMEYGFSIAAPGPGAETVLVAAELDTGTLDWHDFDLLASGEVMGPAGGSLGAVISDLPGGDTSIVYAGLPAPVRFRGMPSRSWWEFDDGSIDFGAITAPVESLTTSVLVEYAIRYGNDHFLIPVPLSVGSVLRVDSLVVVDTFGEVLVVNPVAEVDGPTGPFRLFELSVPGPAPPRDPLFVLFPALGGVVEGVPIEEVHFIRDDAAELVWAVEDKALGADGLPADRTVDALAHFQPLTPTPNSAATLPSRRYLLRTDVEANWFPFLLAKPALLAMADVPPLDTSQATPVPWGRILAPFAPVPATPGPQPGVLLPVEEVTPAGIQVTRAWRYARWIDGRQLSWVGRRVRPGYGPGASGLTFDLAL